ncbi:hypothetical protein BJY54_006485 [Streptomyces nodosus]|nr:hypothetical protein [Streptomyces nodosus]
MAPVKTCDRHVVDPAERPGTLTLLTLPGVPDEE